VQTLVEALRADLDPLGIALETNGQSIATACQPGEEG
jgi:hypothetical protein